MSRFRSWCLVFLAAAQLSCGAEKLLNPPDDAVTASTISVVAGTGQTAVEGIALASPVVVQVNGTNGAAFAGASVSFSVGNNGGVSPSSGTTGADGRVTTIWTLGLGAGTQTLTATSGSFQTQVTATATTAVVPIASITVSPATVDLRALGATATLSASALSAAGQPVTPQPTFTWTSSDPAKATVSAAGVVTAVANGSTTISAVASGVTGTRAVTVAQVVSKIVTTDSITLTNTTDSVTATATVTDSLNQAMTGVSLTWSSTNEAVAKVTSAGKVYAIANGATRVRATASNGVFDSTFVVVNLPAVAPAVPTLTATQISATQINLSWTNVAGETGYRVERCLGASCSSFTLLTTTAADVVTYSNTGLSANSYTYRVRAENGAAASAYSTSATATTLVPGTPILTASAVSSTQVNLTWFDVANETTYELERCSGVSCVSFANIVTANQLSYNNTGVTANTTYSYRLRGVNGGVAGAYSTVQTVNTIVPGTPVISVVPTTTSTIDITWADVANETSYDIEFCAGAGCTPTILATVTAGGTSYSHTGRVAETAYRYRVRARNNLIFSPYTSTVDVGSYGLNGNGTCVTTCTTIAASLGLSKYFFIDVDAGMDSLIIQLSPGTGDADLFVKYGSMPLSSGTGVYTSTASGAAKDRVSIPAPTAGRWYIKAFAYTTFSGWEIHNTPVQLVQDPSFEASYTYWAYASSAFPLFNFVPRSGSRAASLGVNSGGTAVNSSSGSVYQDIKVPATAGTVEFEYYYRITTSESPTETTAYDYMYVSVRLPSGSTLATAATYSNLNLTNSYVRGVINLSAYRGQTIRLWFESTSDNTLPTHFQVDDVKMYWSTIR